jgi:hypothetical protein
MVSINLSVFFHDILLPVGQKASFDTPNPGWYSHNIECCVSRSLKQFNSRQHRYRPSCVTQRICVGLFPRTRGHGGARRNPGRLSMDSGDEDSSDRAVPWYRTLSGGRLPESRSTMAGARNDGAEIR